MIPRYEIIISKAVRALSRYPDSYPVLIFTEFRMDEICDIFVIKPAVLIRNFRNLIRYLLPVDTLNKSECIWYNDFRLSVHGMSAAFCRITHDTFFHCVGCAVIRAVAGRYFDRMKGLR